MKCASEWVDGHSTYSDSVEVRAEENSGSGVGGGTRASGDQIGASGLYLLRSNVKTPVSKKVAEPFGDLSLSALFCPGIPIRIDGGNADEALKKVGDRVHRTVES
jgi:hypothetical protein